ncbi:hypothetical protein AB0G15_38000 [Streptosporangium sp. NPDC023825]|uniref:hypothetical protein n=1 Tax=Streptosporangium sp. NPDC023825 TaxID=3154909 RepID=UPI0034181EF1
MTIETACVIGVSFAGLPAARTPADHARRLVLLEDVLAPGAVGHTSVPQGRHGHFLQPAALEKLEDWFPGFTDDAVARGAVLAPPGHHSLFTNSEPMADSEDIVRTRPVHAGRRRPGACRCRCLRDRGRPLAGLDRFPAGLVDIGDAVATYNPVHGIGMASALNQASLLADSLAGRSGDFLRMREAVVDEAWAVGAGR